jgi:protein involved in polysaccharide export with SLBB domain
MALKSKSIASVIVLVAAASMSLPDRAENRDGAVNIAKAEIEKPATPPSSLVNSGFIAQQSIGAILTAAPVQLARSDERGERTDRVDAADTTTVSDDPGVDLTGAERVRLRILGMNDSSGEYGIEQGAISIPGIGRVSIAGRTSKSLEAHLSARMTAMTRREVVVSIEIARYQPFYATGLVARAGALDWRPGLTVIQAVALAGGLLRSGGEDAPERSVVMHQSRSQLQFALAQYERLKAEKDGKNTVQPSARLLELSATVPQSNRAAVADFLARQNQVLEEQKASLNSQVASLEREQTAAEKEVEAAEVQARVAAQQVVITRQLMDGLNQLKAQGNIANARYLAQQNDVLTAEVRLAESRALVERARARVATIERQMTILRQERRATLNERIEALEREIAQHELILAGSSGMREPESGPAVEFNIARRTSTGMSTNAATLFTEIQPGDVVIVSSAGVRGAQTASAPPAPGNSATAALQRAHSVIDASTVSSGPGAARATNPLR